MITSSQVRNRDMSYPRYNVRRQQSDSESHKFSSKNKRQRHPSKLKGKEIGLFYAQISKEKTRRKEMETLGNIKIALNKELEISKLLEKIENNAEEKNMAIPIFESKLIGPKSADNISCSIEEQFSHIKESSFKREFLENVKANILSCTERIERQQINAELIRNNELDLNYKQDFLSKQHSEQFQKMFEFRQKLPAFSFRTEILRTVRNNSVVIISGETGSGKTTQVPQFLLDEYLAGVKGSLCKIICTQPRRISAISVSDRVAAERDEHLGMSVGYHIRLECKLPRELGSITYCTPGIVLQWLINDPFLSKISHIIVDEIHERDIQTDLLISYLKQLLLKRSDLKVVLMSATLNEEFSEYFGKCPVVHVGGSMYPVQDLFLEDVLKFTKFNMPELKLQKWFNRDPVLRNQVKEHEEYQKTFELYFRRIEKEGIYPTEVLKSLKNYQIENINLDLLMLLIQHICNNMPRGAILVFLPGWEQISNFYKMFTSNTFYSKEKHLLLPLHSLMPTINQKQIFETPPDNVWKIILSTNIAETSITINDIIYVVDSGKTKMKNYDCATGLITLNPEWISEANAKQRLGRAGRLQPGICFRLYHRGRAQLFAPHMIPELLRSRLEEIVLQIKILKLGKAQSFLELMMTPPSRQALKDSLKLLRKISALDNEENLTPLGFLLARLPMDPQAGKMILLGAIFSCLDPMLTIAAVLSFKDAFIVPLEKQQQVDKQKQCIAENSKSDHIMHYFAYSKWEKLQQSGNSNEYCWENFLSMSILKMLFNMKNQFIKYLFDLQFIDSMDCHCPKFNINSDNLSLIRALTCAGLYPNVAKIVRPAFFRNRFKDARLVTEGENRVYIHPRSVNQKETYYESKWLVYKQKVKSTKIFLHDCTMVHPYSLLFFGESLFPSKNSEHNIDLICVDKFVKFKCSLDTAKLIQKLRLALDQILEHKVSHPHVSHWDAESDETNILRTIVELITSEAKVSSYRDENMEIPP